MWGCVGEGRPRASVPQSTRRGAVHLLVGRAGAQCSPLSDASLPAVRGTVLSGSRWQKREMPGARKVCVVTVVSVVVVSLRCAADI